MPLQLKGVDLELVFIKGHVEGQAKSMASTAQVTSNGPAPFCRFVNIELCGTPPQCGATSMQGTILLENPRGDFLISVPELVKQVAIVFGLHGRKIGLYRSKNRSNGTFVIVIYKL